MFQYSMPAFCSGPPLRKPRNHSTQRCLARSSIAPTKVSRSKAADVKFAAWAEENGIEMSCLSLTEFGDETKAKSASRGMTAEKPLKKGDRMITVAHKTALQVTSLDKKQSPFPSKIEQESWQRLPWFARLGLLIVDAKLDPKSNLQPWISRLPKSFDTPLHWSDEELNELQSPQMVEAVKQQRSLYKKLFDGINSNSNNMLARDMKYSDFVWAVECVRSRAFSGPLEVAPFKERIRLFLFIAANTLAWPALHVLPLENALNGGLTALFAIAMYDVILPKILRILQGVELRRFAMTPGIDFLNHSSSVTGRAEVAFEYFTNKFVVESGEDYEEGDQVFISYGAQSNDSFLQYYGFVEEKNPADTVTFGSDIEKMLGVVQGKLVARHTGFDDSTINAVSKKLGGKRDAALTALRELCDAELGRMGTSVEEDEELLKCDTEKRNSRAELAIRYRKAKKELLYKALGTLPEKR